MKIVKDPENKDRHTKSEIVREQRRQSEQPTGYRKRKARESDYCRRLREGFEMMEGEDE